MIDRSAFLDDILAKAVEALARLDFDMASRWFEVALEVVGAEESADA